MARKPGSRSEITGPRLREAALRLFARDGYAAVSMRQIAAEVGVQAGALYLYTADKQSLLADLMADHLEALLAAWAAEASIDERFGTTATHMLRAYFRALVSRLGLSTEQPMTAKRRSAVECWKFRMIWARSRGTALVLAAQRPRDSNGQELPDPHRLLADGNENIGMMLARGGEGLSESLLSSIARLKGIELQSPANRVVCPPAEMPALRRRLLAVDTPPELRESHLIDEVAHRALLRADLGEFFERRRTLILDAEKRWVEERNGSVDIVRDQRTYSQG